MKGSRFHNSVAGPRYHCCLWKLQWWDIASTASLDTLFGKIRSVKLWTNLGSPGFLPPLLENCRQRKRLTWQIQGFIFVQRPQERWVKGKGNATKTERDRLHLTLLPASWNPRCQVKCLALIDLDFTVHMIHSAAVSFPGRFTRNQINKQ